MNLYEIFSCDFLGKDIILDTDEYLDEEETLIHYSRIVDTGESITDVIQIGKDEISFCGTPRDHEINPISSLDQTLINFYRGLTKHLQPSFAARVLWTLKNS